MNVSILGAVIFYNCWLIAGIIEEMQLVIALGHVHDVLSMQDVIGSCCRCSRSSGFCDNLLDPEALRVVAVLDLHIARLADRALCHLLQLPAVLPGISPCTVIRRIPDRIISDVNSVIRSQFVFPVFIPVSICNCFLRCPKGSCGVGIALLVQDVPAAVVFVGPGRAVRSCCGVALVVHSPLSSRLLPVRV